MAFTEEQQAILDATSKRTAKPKMTEEQEQVLAAVNQRIQPEQEPSGFLDEVQGAAETVGAIGSGIIGSAAGGALGLSQMAMSELGNLTGLTNEEPADTAANVSRTVQDSLQIQPQSQAGKRNLQFLGDLAQYGIDVARIPLSGIGGLVDLISGGGLDSSVDTIGDIKKEGFGKTIAEPVFQATGSPALAALAEASPDIVGAITGAGAGRAAVNKVNPPAPINQLPPKTSLTLPALEGELKSQGMTVSSVIDDLKNSPQLLLEAPNAKEAVNSLIVHKIKNHHTDGELATKMIGVDGSVKTDKLGAEAIKQGFEPGDVQAVKAASIGSKPNMIEMLNIHRRVHRNTRLGVDINPAQVIGDSTLNRYKHIINEADISTKKLDSIAETELRGMPVNADAIVDGLKEGLSRFDIELDESVFPPKANFLGSMISKDRSAQRVVKDVIDLLAEDVTVDGLRAHKLKRQIDKMINYRKGSRDGLTPTGQKFAKAIRATVNDTLRKASPDYATVNDRLSFALDSLNDFNDALGSIKPLAEGAEIAIGTDLRGVLSKRKTWQGLKNSLDKLDSTAKELGGEFNDDIGDLINFNAILEKQFGSTKRTGFGAESENSNIRAGKKLMRGKAGIQEIVIDSVAKGADKLRNINDEQAFKILNDILERE